MRTNHGGRHPIQRVANGPGRSVPGKNRLSVKKPGVVQAAGLAPRGADFAGANLVCGVYERNAPRASGVGAMLAALPGSGRAERWLHGPVAMACRELVPNTADPAAPLLHRCQPGLTIAADVRLDNRSEVAETLGIPASEVASLQDAELVLRAYERWGADCSDRLVGDWAFALWDAAAQRLFCSRDAVGARSFYYSAAQGRFSFASELDALLAAPAADDRIDEDYLVGVLARQVRVSGRTFFRAVRSLPPGHSLTVTAGTERLERWWRPEQAPPAPCGSDEEYAQRFLDHYARAVRDRLRGAHPLGLHLSGGLDSSSIAALAARELQRQGRRAEAFSWHPPPKHPLPKAEAAEYDRMEAIANREGLPLHYQVLSAPHILAMLRRDGVRVPDRECNTVVESLVQRQAAARGVHVLLSGWGGDECASFNGRGLYPELLSQFRLRRLFLEVLERTDRPFRYIIANGFLPLLHGDAPRFVRRLRRGRLRSVKASYVHPAFHRQARKLYRRSERGASVRRFQLALLRHGHLERRIEDWAASGARLGIVYRYPLLDRRLIEFALGLPSEQFRSGPWNRCVMRRALDGILPREICWNPSKREVALAAAEDGRRAAFATIRDHLVARTGPLTRSRYVDMPRLIAALDPQALETSRHGAKLLIALQILDW